MGSIWRRLQLLWATLLTILIPAIALFYFMPSATQWFGGQLFKMLQLWTLFVICYSIYFVAAPSTSVATDPGSDSTPMLSASSGERVMM